MLYYIIYFGDNLGKNVQIFLCKENNGFSHPNIVLTPFKYVDISKNPGMWNHPCGPNTQRSGSLSFLSPFPRCLSLCRYGHDITHIVLFPGEGNDYLLQYSCLENSMDSGVW